ncbi:MAG: ankyrin repeat domain-containing protein [Proteobacteria bacterium]|nr:ankyrin repeat domain-containing protein [Pseudomonadota bacterium]
MGKQMMSRLLTSLAVFFAVICILIGSESESAALRSSAFNNSPEHTAIIEILQEDGDSEILQSASSVGMITQGDFATVSIAYLHDKKPASTVLYLFNEESTWVAYRKLPTQKDHPAIFTTLAQHHCIPLFKNLQGIGFPDESLKSKDPKKRRINVVCSELIDNQWLDHRLALTYEYDQQGGWHVTGDHDMASPVAKIKPPMQRAQKKHEVKTSTKNVASADETAFLDEVIDHFFLSIMEGDMAMVKGFLDTGISVGVKRPRFGHSPLYAAVMGNHEEIALMFLQLGGDPNFKDENSATPLLNAASNCKSVRLVKALLAAGADVNAQAKGGGTPLMLAEAMQCIEIAKLLRKAGAH